MTKIPNFLFIAMVLNMCSGLILVLLKGYNLINIPSIVIKIIIASGSLTMIGCLISIILVIKSIEANDEPM